MRVWLQRRIEHPDRQPAGHSEMNVESIAVVERDDDPFASPVDGGNDSAKEMPLQIRAGGIENISSLKPYTGEDAAYDPGPERSDDGFNFGQFGHRDPW